VEVTEVWIEVNSSVLVADVLVEGASLGVVREGGCLVHPVVIQEGGEGAFRGVAYLE
jgi:hypothetical protein